MISPTPSILSDEEIDKICEPLEQPGAQVRYLRSLGLFVNRKPSGRALVARSEFERVLGSQRFGAAESAGSGPNIAAIRERWSNRSSNGTQAQKR